ncbi:Sugar phosphate isomerase/epimerase [Acidaminobacter hydrogenoformans DSM 2784]|uniref:Sugar phosphate isomerase/epimerase n=2 Tax=Acidaminobacter TaxID=65402 RepID=A0A1G5RZ23_9FIRM|nr:Sugar phosphate isomerase/epimerase [Acidaminobacter hydrogenoformans DSM 2784]
MVIWYDNAKILKLEVTKLIKSVVISDDVTQSRLSPLVGELGAMIAEAARLGFQAVQIAVNNPAELDGKRLRGLLEAHGMKVSGIATGKSFIVDGLYMGAEDERIRRQAVDRLLGHIDLAAELGGANVIIGAIRGSADLVGSPARHEENVTKSLKEVLPYAEEKGVVITIEAICQKDLAGADSFSDIKALVAYIKAFNSRCLRLHLDTYHMLLSGQEPYRSIMETEGLLEQVDLSDADRGYPSGAHFDFAGLMKALKAIDYRGILTFEYANSSEENTAELGLRYVEGLMG